MPEGRPGAGAVAVAFFGSLLLVVPLSVVATTRTIEVAGALLGVDRPLRGWFGRAVRLAGIAVGFKVASDAAAIRLGGYGVLTRGPFTSRLGGLLLASWVALASGVLAADVGYALVLRGVRSGRLASLGTGLLLLGALAWAAIRSGRAFLDGIRV